MVITDLLSLPWITLDLAQLSVGQRASSEAIHACKRRVSGASSAASKLRIGQGLRTEKVRSWRNSPRCIYSRCRNFSTHFTWRRLAVSSSVFSHDTPASGVFRTSSTELARKTDPDDEGIVVPNQAAIGFPAADPHEGRIQTYSSGVARPYIYPRWPSSPGSPSPRISCDSLTGAANSFRNGRLRQTPPPRVRHCLRASPERVTHAPTWRNAMF